MKTICRLKNAKSWPPGSSIAKTSQKKNVIIKVINQKKSQRCHHLKYQRQFVNLNTLIDLGLKQYIANRVVNRFGKRSLNDKLNDKLTFCC